MSRPVEIGLAAVVTAVTGERPRILVVRGGGVEAELPIGALDPARDRTLELALRTRIGELTGFELGYVEQLYTFGNRYRHPEERQGGPRVVSIAYLALVREGPLAPTLTVLSVRSLFRTAALPAWISTPRRLRCISFPGPTMVFVPLWPLRGI